MSESLPPAIVLDNGSGYLKIGFSSHQEPLTIPALIGRQMLRYGETVNVEQIAKEDPAKVYKDIMIGDEVIPYRNLLELSYPIKNGIIESTEDLCRLWEYAITKKLGVEDVSDKKVLVTEAPMNPFINKEKMLEILFEQIGVDSVNIEPQAKCSLFCEGKDTGIVLDSGDGVTHVIPIYNGIILKLNIDRMNIAGRHITEYLTRLFQKKGYAFNSTVDFELVREMKEKFCFISNDIQGDRKLARETTYYNSFYKLPDGSRIHISDEKFEATECLFEPYLIGEEIDGVHEMTFKCINNCPIDTRTALYANILTSGATTLFPGFVSRVENEIKILYKDYALKNLKENEKEAKIKINVMDNPRRKHSVFLGGCVIAKYYNTKESFDYWVNRQEWLECGEPGDKSRENKIKEKIQSL